MLNRKVTWLLLIFLAFSLWYNEKYGMDYAQKREINAPIQDFNILIATQGSQYKNRVTSIIADSLSNQPVYVKIIDVNELPKQDHHLYQAIVIMHTWEIWMSPRAVKQFIRTASKDKIYVLSTSGSGELMFEGMDGFSTASVMDDVVMDSERILKWIYHKISLAPNS